MHQENVKQANELFSFDRVGFRLRINKKKMFYFLFSVVVIASLIEPPYIYQTNSFLHAPFLLLKYASSALVVLFFILNKSKLNSFLITILTFEGLLFVSTFINSRTGPASISEWVSDSAYSIILVLFMHCVFDIDPKLLTSAFTAVLGLYVHINTLTWFLFPKGMYINAIGSTECWFLGYDNIACVIIILAEIIALYRISIHRNRLMLWDWSVIISGTFFSVVQSVATAVLAEVAFFIFILLAQNKDFRRIFGKAKLIVIAMFVLFFAIQFFSVQDNEFTRFVFSLLGKDTTFTGRTLIWTRALRELYNGGLLYGKGSISGSVLAKHIGYRSAVHLHSYYLQVLYEGGIITFIAFLVMIFNSANIFDKKERAVSSMVFLSGLMALMLMWQVEASANLIRYFFIVLFMIHNVSTYEELAGPEKIRQRRIKFRI